MIYASFSSEETRKFAELRARNLFRNIGSVPRRRGASKSASIRDKRAAGALVIALEGDLGSGKTTFVQGFLRGLGVRRRSPSPTFILFRRFTLRKRSNVESRPSDAVNVYHVDAYRIKNPRELVALGIKDIFSDPKNIVLVEWAEKIRRILPRSAIKIRFSHGRKENERTIDDR